jgi:hypothetical protein
MEHVGVAGAQHAPRCRPLAEQIALADPDPDDAIDPGEEAGELEGLQRKDARIAELTQGRVWDIAGQRRRDRGGVVPALSREGGADRLGADAAASDHQHGWACQWLNLPYHRSLKIGF